MWVRAWPDPDMPYRFPPSYPCLLVDAMTWLMQDPRSHSFPVKHALSCSQLPVDPETPFPGQSAVPRGHVGVFQSEFPALPTYLKKIVFLTQIWH